MPDEMSVVMQRARATADVRAEQHEKWVATFETGGRENTTGWERRALERICIYFLAAVILITCTDIPTYKEKVM
jgi:hypothetical protein